MEQIIAECKFIWTEEYLQDVIRILQKGRGGTTLHNSEYNLIKKYKLVSLGGVEKVAFKKTDGYMATKQVALLVITNAHSETGHGGEKATWKQIKDQYHNIPMADIAK